MIVWSFGGGVQSVALAALVQLGRLPMPDLIVIADTGREVDTTWATVERMRSSGFEIHVAPHSLATVDLYASNGDLLIPAYSRQSGRKGAMSTFCSNEWKQRPVRRWLRARGVEQCEMWLGISVDEAHRMKPSGLDWLSHVYPLIDLGIRRRDCPGLIASAGFAQPDKSRCYMCPYQSRDEWRSLSDADLQRARDLERDIRAADPDVYLHRLAVPLDEALAIDDQQGTLFDGCDSGQCWT